MSVCRYADKKYCEAAGLRSDRDIIAADRDALREKLAKAEAEVTSEEQELSPRERVVRERMAWLYKQLEADLAQDASRERRHNVLLDYIEQMVAHAFDEGRKK